MLIFGGRLLCSVSLEYSLFFWVVSGPGALVLTVIIFVVCSVFST